MNPEDYGTVKGETVGAPQVQGYSYAPRNRLPIKTTLSPVPDIQSKPHSEPNSGVSRSAAFTVTEPTAADTESPTVFTQSECPATWVLTKKQKGGLPLLQAPFSFAWSSDKQRANQQSDQDNQPGNKTTDVQTAAIQAAYESAYSKQNMAAEKQSFLDHQKGDYSTYLDNHYITPTDAAHLRERVRLFRLSVETGINSSLPGIVAQVYENVFDSLTGQNILNSRDQSSLENIQPNYFRPKPCIGFLGQSNTHRRRINLFAAECPVPIPGTSRTARPG